MRIRKTAIAATVLALLPLAVDGQESTQPPLDDQERGAHLKLWDRRPPKQASAAPPRTSAGGRTRRQAAPAKPIGIGYTLFAPDLDGRPMRVDPAQTFFDGDRVRLVVEPNSDGFLYIFNTTDDGPPRMIYPDPRLNGGANRVRAHALYEVPSSAAGDERLQWFTFHSKAGVERLYVIVTRAPLKGIPVGSRLVAHCRTQNQCPVKPTPAVWETVTATMNGTKVVERKAEQYGQHLSPSESLALGERDLGLSPDAPEPSIIRIDATSRAGMIVVTVDLKHE